MQICIICLLAFVIFAAIANGQICENGNKLLHLGTSEEGVKTIANIHNSYRMLIAHGRLHGHPQGTNLLRMSYDKDLENKARVVSLTCEMQHVTVTDPRWLFVGQNLYMEYSSEMDMSQNWDEAIKAWFDENQLYIYPSAFSPSTGHYTQVVWAETDSVGCDFAMFYDYGTPAMPYVKLYTCNYGPGGNVEGQAPYEVDDSSECTNLC